MRKSYLSFISLLSLIIHISFTSISAQTEKQNISIGEQFSFSSKVLNEDVTLFIHLPNGYTGEREYPVLYLLDGEYFFTQLVSTVEYLSNCAYVQMELIPKFIIVGIATKNRNKDFTPTHAEDQYGMGFKESGGAEKYYEFLKNELFTFMNKNYSVSDKRLLTGWSLGGLFTTYCYLNHPDDFDYYLAVSPSFWWDNLVSTKQLKEVIKKGKLPQKKFTITIGSLEKNPMASSVKESFVPVISEVADSNLFQFFEIENESHSFSPFTAFYKGLQSIFYNWSMPDSLLLEKNFDKTDAFILNLSGDYGYSGVRISGATYHLYLIALSQSNYNTALKIALYRAARFPKSTYAQYNLGEMYYRLDDKKSALVHIKKALEIERAKEEPSEKLLKQFEADVIEVSDAINNG